MGGGRLRASAKVRRTRSGPPAQSAAVAGSVRPTPLFVSPLEGGRDELGKGDGWGVGGYARAPAIVVCAERFCLDHRLARARCVPPPLFVSPWKGGEMNWGRGMVGGLEVTRERQRSLSAQRRFCLDHRLARARCVPTPSLSPPWKGGEIELGKGDGWGVGGYERAPAIAVCAEAARLDHRLARARCVPPPSSSPPWEGGEMNWGKRMVEGLEVTSGRRRSLSAQRRSCLDLRLARARCVPPPSSSPPWKGGEMNCS